MAYGSQGPRERFVTKQGEPETLTEFITPGHVCDDTRLEKDIMFSL